MLNTNYSFTKQEKILTFLLQWWVLIFFVAGVAFAVFPNYIIYGLNVVGHSIFKWRGPVVSFSDESFWLVLATGYMIVLVYSAFKAQQDIIKNINFVKIIILSKFVSTIGYLVCFFFIQKSFAYLAGGIIDGLIFFLTYTFYKRAIVSRYVK